MYLRVRMNGRKLATSPVEMFDWVLLLLLFCPLFHSRYCLCGLASSQCLCLFLFCYFQLLFVDLLYLFCVFSWYSVRFVAVFYCVFAITEDGEVFRFNFFCDIWCCCFSLYFCFLGVVCVHYVLEMA